MPRTEPQRSCLGCRAVKDKKDLLRFVLAPDMTLVPDLQTRLPGRGAYTCLKRSCLIEAAVRKQFSRTFKVEARFGSPEVLANLVASRMEERIAGYLALANKAGQVASGGDAVAERLGGGKAGIICLAADISPDIARKVIFQAERAGVMHFSLLDKEKLGALLGKSFRSVVAVDRGGFSDTISKELERYRNFLEGELTQNE